MLSFFEKCAKWQKNQSISLILKKFNLKDLHINYNFLIALAIFSLSIFCYHYKSIQDYIIFISGPVFLSLPFFGFFFYLFILTFLSLSTFFFSVHGVHLISTVGVAVFWVSQLFFLNKFVYESRVSYLHIDFMSMFGGETQFTITLALDFISFGFLFLTTSIGVCAVAYSLTYFKNEPHADRFILFLNWFIISMSLLVISDNAILLFLGWELIGLTSFFLINFWTTRRGTLKAALKAFIFNKLSDVFLLFFIGLLSCSAGSTSISAWLSYLAVTDFTYSNIIFVATFFVILAASIKSAQFGPHVWLPDSMEAPIPASALIHSATLVSAGVYLLLRFYEYIMFSNLQYFVGFLGAVTACYGAVVSAAQTDCKKLLAYSTISHCGFLFVTIALNNFSLSMLYLYLHGFFKAMTFFCVGNLVRYANGSQDCRRMGALLSALPIEAVLISVCAFNLGALPLTVGYMYKHFFQVFLLNYPALIGLLPFLLFGMLCSCIYVFRLVYYSMFDINKGHKNITQSTFDDSTTKPHYSNTTVLSVLFITFFVLFAFYISEFYYAQVPNLDGLLLNTFSSFLNATYVYSNTLATLCFLYFYGFFGVVFFILMSSECRVEFSYMKKKYIYFFFILYFFISFFLFNSIILF